MNKKHNEGFTLIEVLIAIVLLGMVVVPICSSLVMSFRMNAKTEELLQAQLVVSSTAEILMATGISEAKEKYDIVVTNGVEEDYFPEVAIQTVLEKESPDDPSSAYNPFYKVTITHDVYPEVTVTTHIRGVTPEGGTTP